MSIPTRILLVLIGLRLLLPPGICVCKLSSPVARLAVRILGGEMPPAAPEGDDHHPGCPASMLALGLGVKPVAPSVDPPDAPSIAPLLPSTPAPLVGFEAAPPAHAVIFSAAPLYVSHCALLF